MHLRTRSANILLARGRRAIAEFLSDVDANPTEDWNDRLVALHAQIDDACNRARDQSDAFHNDLYVLHRSVGFLRSYAGLWRCIATGAHTESWSLLQDCLDDLRTIRAFSEIDIVHFETQLLELEKAYPYVVFFSIGATVERFECSLCGFDIDSLDCPHRRGHLYRGRMAAGIAKNMVALDHVAMVPVPRDKRCVINYENDDPRFSIVRMLGQQITAKQMKPSQFRCFRFSKRRVPNREVRIQGRNEICACGSRQKFKRCCATKAYQEVSHVQIVAEYSTGHLLNSCRQPEFRAGELSDAAV